MRTRLATIIFAICLAACSPSEESPASPAPAARSMEVNLYSARHYDADLKLYERFTEQTGIKVNRIEGNPDQLIARLQAEGAGSSGDVFLAADAGALWRAQEAGLFQPAKSTFVRERIPESLRDPEENWFGFSRRARIIAYDSARVSPEEVDTYEEIASSRFAGKLCVRSADHVYNLSLVGALIEAWGPERARAWVGGVVSNLARPPEGGDRDQIRAVGAGVCEIALTNSYYFIRMANGEDSADREITSRVKLQFPSLDGQGAHVNISGGGLLAGAPNRENGVRLLEFLASAESQTLVSRYNNEYPASPDVPAPDPVAPYAAFSAHPMPVSLYGPRQSEALAMMSEAGWR